MNLQEEVRNGYTISAQMKKIWALQMDMTRKLLQVCQKHNLKVWAASGTLLGCIREKGFIPWDDDIDMLMLRDDYDKLVAIANDEFKSPYFLQTAYSEKVPFPRAHAQLRYDGTAAILPYDIPYDFHQGIFVDIFVLDGIPAPEDIDAKLKRVNDLKTLMQRKMDGYRPKLASPTTWFRWIKLQAYFLTHSFVSIYRQFEDELRSDSVAESPYITKIGLFSNKEYVSTRMLDKHWYDETLYLPFEDMEMPVPAGYDQVLKTIFGADYMKPAKAPSAHGGFAVLDTERSYKEFLPELRAKNRKA